LTRPRRKPSSKWAWTLVFRRSSGGTRASWSRSRFRSPYLLVFGCLPRHHAADAELF